MAWLTENNQNGLLFTNTYLQFNKDDYFQTINNKTIRVYDNNYFGKADMWGFGNSNILNSIKQIETHSNFPIQSDDARTDVGVIQSGKIPLAVNNAQSIDMSLMSAVFVLANAGTTEENAVKNYNGEGVANYEKSVLSRLQQMGTSYLN